MQSKWNYTKNKIIVKQKIFAVFVKISLVSLYKELIFLVEE